MSEEYGVETGFIRSTTPPERAKRGSNPKKARYTGLSIASLRANISGGKLEDKIRKYNEEYERLTNLAVTIDEGRADVEAGKMDYADVAKNIKAYNEQARRLAEIGVQVLVLNQDIQKITFAKEEMAKAIRVPGFLIGPLRLLTAAGREKARLEKEARMEKEQAIYDSIVTTAEEAIGQVKESTIDGDKFESLSFPNLAQTVESSLVAEPSSDIPEEVEPVGKTEEELAAEEEARKAKEAAERQAAADAAAAVEKRRQAIDEGLKNAYKKKPASVKKKEESAAAVAAVNENDTFAILSNVNSLFHLALVKKDDNYVEMLEVMNGDKRAIITPTRVSEMVGITDKKEAMEVYKHMVNVAKLASHWEKTAVYEIQESETDVKRVEAFSEEGRVLFDFVVSAVKEGMTAEEIKEKAASELTAVEANVIASVVSNLDVFKAGIESVEYLSQPENVEAKDDGIEVPPVVGTDDVVRRREVVDKKIAELAMLKYGRKVEGPPVEEEEPVVEVPPVVDDKTNDGSEGAPVTSDEEKTDVPKAVEGGYVAQIGALVSEIAELSAHRDRLRDILGDEASNELDAINRAISNKLSQINALALGGIVTLGKDGEKKADDTPVIDSVEVEEEEPVVEASPVVDATGMELKVDVEEKAEIDARAVNGVRVRVNAFVENFKPGERYVATANVNGKHVTVVVEDSEEYVPAEAEEVEVHEENPAIVSGEEQRDENPAIVSGEVQHDENPAIVSGEVQHDEDLGKAVVNPVEAGEEEAVVTPEEVVAEPAAELDDSSYYDRGLLSDEAKEDAIAWWSMMAPILDDPKQQALTEMNVAELERREAEERAQREIDKRKWEKNKNSRIEDGWLPLDEEARAQRLEEQERIKEQIARSKLRHCKYFVGLEDIDATIDGMIAEDEELHNAQDVVSMIARIAPQAYEEMEEKYRDEKMAKLNRPDEMSEGKAK